MSAARVTFTIEPDAPTSVEVAGSPPGTLPSEDELVEVIGTAAELALGQSGDDPLALASVNQKIMERLVGNAAPPVRESQR